MSEAEPRSQAETVLSRRQLVGTVASLPALAAGAAILTADPPDDARRGAASSSYRLTGHIRAYYDAARF